jgi:hypothetical protein
MTRSWHGGRQAAGRREQANHSLPRNARILTVAKGLFIPGKTKATLDWSRPPTIMVFTRKESKLK